MNRPPFICFAFLLGVFCLNSEAWELGISSGALIPDSVSPDNRFACFEAYYEDMGVPVPTTACDICIADTGRTRVLAVLPCHTKRGTDVPYKDYLKILWNKSGQYVAVHDSLNKHSRVKIYHFDGKVFVQVALPDIYSEFIATLEMKASLVKSSGQMPLEWTPEGDLVVEQRIVIKDGRTLRRREKITLH